VRFVIYGAGGIGGVVGARLFESGHQVMLIARGAHYEAIASRGLTLETPEQRTTFEIPVAPSPAEIAFTDEDLVLLGMKTQDSLPALDALRAAAGCHIPVGCMQNGVENERLAIRRFSDVYGIVVMCPTSHMEPGVVQSYGTKLTGDLDIGRYPAGTDERCAAVATALSSSHFASEAKPDIIRLKYAKLISNLGNAVQAICGVRSEDGEDANRLTELAKAEGVAVLEAAEIDCRDDFVSGMADRWRRWGVAPIGDQPRGGGSTWQSVIRGQPVETDYLTGEIVMQGRLSGIPTPVNAMLQDLMVATVAGAHEPGWLTAAEILARLGARGA
jgi:2-dehydropantoate 2-reductase